MICALSRFKLCRSFGIHYKKMFWFGFNFLLLFYCFIVKVSFHLDAFFRANFIAKCAFW